MRGAVIAHAIERASLRRLRTRWDSAGSPDLRWWWTPWTYRFGHGGWFCLSLPWFRRYHSGGPRTV